MNPFSEDCFLNADKFNEQWLTLSPTACAHNALQMRQNISKKKELHYGFTFPLKPTLSLE